MGMISELVVAPENIGDELGRHANPSEQWQTLHAKGVETVKLAKLYCAASNKPYDNSIQRSFSFVGGDKEEGPWVFVFPEVVVRSFAAIKQVELSIVAERWIATDELKAERWSTKDGQEFVAELSSLAKSVLSSGRSLYLWLAL